jgi:hypothetical protein
MYRKIAVGSEIDSYCGREKCKMVLNHVVVAMVGDQPRRVRCLTCQSEHNHRGVTTPKTRSRSAGAAKRTTKTTRTTRANRWQMETASWDGMDAKAYSVFATFEVDDWVKHTSFGNGKVIEVPSPDRIIALFESGEKMLMQGKEKK